MDFDTGDDFGLSLREDEHAATRAATEVFMRLSNWLSDGGALSTLIAALPGEDLSAAIASESNLTLRKRFLNSAADVVTPAALLILARTSATAYSKPLSKPLLALLNKLAREAQQQVDQTRLPADQSFRDLFKQIVDAWSFGSLDTGASTFYSLFQEADRANAIHIAGTAAPEPERVIQFAFETGAIGNVVWSAVATLGEGEGVRRLLEMIKQAPPNSRAADAVAQQFANPTRLAMLLHEDPVDFRTIDALLPRMRSAATSVMLDALVDSKARETRRALLQRVIAIGPQVCTAVLDRLAKDERWFVQRNMLAILKDVGCPPTQLPIDKYLSHADPRVRREALQLQFNDPGQRDRALVKALKETDSQTLKVALQAARQGFPDAAIPVLAKRVVESDFPNEFRVVVLQLLGRSTSLLALEPLLRFVMGGTTLLGKPKLAPKSPEMLMALSGIARNWPNDRRVAPLLAAARESKDREIMQAAS